MPGVRPRNTLTSQTRAEHTLNHRPDSHDLGFTYRARKSGEVVILHHGRLASTLRGNEAEDFKQEVGDASTHEAQQLMARLTGNYKHGNEREASEHPRNRR